MFMLLAIECMIAMKFCCLLNPHFLGLSSNEHQKHGSAKRLRPTLECKQILSSKILVSLVLIYIFVGSLDHLDPKCLSLNN